MRAVVTFAFTVLLSSIMVPSQQQHFKFEVEVEDTKMTEVEVEFNGARVTENHGVNNMLLPMMIWMMNKKNRKKCPRCKCLSTHKDLPYKVPEIPCGPKECKKKCKVGKEVCYMSLLIRCIQEPCCPIWSCQTCPSQPEFGVRKYIIEISMNRVNRAFFLEQM